MRTYEAIFILDQRKCEDGGDGLAQEVCRNIENLGGRVESRNNVGRRQFARPIRKQHAGIYWGFVFDLDPDKVAEFKEAYRLNDMVFRAEVVLYVAPPRRKSSRDREESSRA